MEPLTEAEIDLMRRNLTERQRAESERLQALRARAREDAARIVAHIAKEYQPTRIYQWGSLVRGEHFSDRSDIDIAVEGIGEPAVYFRLLAEGEKMTSFELDIVQLEHIEPAYADGIRNDGVVAYDGSSDTAEG